MEEISEQAPLILIEPHTSVITVKSKKGIIAAPSHQVFSSTRNIHNWSPWAKDGNLGAEIRGNFVDRFCTLWDIIGFSGKIFSKDYMKFWQEIDKDAHPAVYIPGSKPMPPNSEYDGFISYRFGERFVESHRLTPEEFAYFFEI